MKVRNVEKKIFGEHKSLMGTSEIDSKYKYVKLARGLPTFGVHFFLVKVRQISLSSLIRVTKFKGQFWWKMIQSVINWNLNFCPFDRYRHQPTIKLSYINRVKYLWKWKYFVIYEYYWAYLGFDKSNISASISWVFGCHLQLSNLYNFFSPSSVHSNITLVNPN